MHAVHTVGLGGSKVNIYQDVRMMSSASMFINPPRKISMVLRACFCSDFVTVKKKTKNPHTQQKEKLLIQQASGQCFLHKTTSSALMDVSLNMNIFLLITHSLSITLFTVSAAISFCLKGTPLLIFFHISYFLSLYILLQQWMLNLNIPKVS